VEEPLAAARFDSVSGHSARLLFELAEDVFPRDPGLNASLSHPELLAEFARETA
jgi:hypothetical protein